MSSGRTGGPGEAKIDRERAVLVVIDVQEAFRPVIPNFAQIARASATLLRAAKEVGIPVIVTEQYPKGLGATVVEVADQLPDGVEPLTKTAFSVAEADGFDLQGRDQAIVCGIETHVCVSQSVLDLLEQDVQVHLVVDGVGSRAELDRELGLGKAERAGAWLTSVETAIFELVRRAGSDEFKSLQKLVMEYTP